MNHLRGDNKITLIGNATRDAELRHIQSGKPVSNILLATNRVVNGQETTQFHTVIYWDKLSDVTNHYVKIGEPLYAEGRLEYRTFEDRDGVERGTVEIVASDVQMLGRRRSIAELDNPEVPASPVNCRLAGRCSLLFSYQVSERSGLRLCCLQ